MKKLYSLFIMLLCVWATTAQLPTPMSYQAIVRNHNNALVAQVSLGIQINILQGSSTGTVVYTETQNPTTNSYGLLSIQIGKNSAYSQIDWSTGPYFIETKIDLNGGTHYSLIGTSQLLAVPYTHYALTARSVLTPLNEWDPLFTEWNKSTDINIQENQISNLKAYLTEEKQGLSDVLAINASAHNTISQVMDPKDQQDLATKAYVDQLEQRLTTLQNLWLETGKHPTKFRDTRDGTEYIAVKIGRQTWMAQNLQYLPEVVDVHTGSNTSPCYYVYGYNLSQTSEAKATAHYQKYGVLYNWEAAMNGSSSSHKVPSQVQGICPDGWHIPSLAEWEIFTNYLADNEFNYDGSIGGGKEKIAKAMALPQEWSASNTNGATGNTGYSSYSNKSGFNALPAGIRTPDGSFADVNHQAQWWSTSTQTPQQAYAAKLHYNSIQLEGIDTNNQAANTASGFSVRCMKDEVSKPVNYKLSLLFTPESSGAVSGKGNYKPNEQVPISATARNKYEFIQWTGDVEFLSDSLSANSVVNMPAQNVTLTAVFDLEKEIPILSTHSITDIGPKQAVGGGTITSDGRSAILARGVCWSSKTTPTINDDKTTDGEGMGSFESLISDLEPYTRYYVRAYATNSVGTAYGNSVNFYTKQDTPTVQTTPITLINPVTAVCGGTIVSNGKASITVHGLCWSTHPTPTLDDNFSAINISVTTDFTAAATELEPNTTYYVRAYASNSQGTGYGQILRFTTNDFRRIIDPRDGNTYKVTSIGDQTWLAENLKYLPSVMDSLTNSLYEPCYHIYRYSGTDIEEACLNDNYQTYGVLYNWFAAYHTACPPGWHLPSHDEWILLENYLGEASVAGGKLKEAGTKHWDSSSFRITNETGFTALPGGHMTTIGKFLNLNSQGSWWSSTNYSTSYPAARNREMRSSSAASTANYKEKQYALSVRCIKDNNQFDQYALTVLSSKPSWGSVEGYGYYDANQPITIKAIPKTGYQFIGWSGDTLYLNNPKDAVTTLTMPAKDISLSAQFEQVNYTLSLGVRPNGAASVSGAGSYHYGTTVRITASVTLPEYQFVYWIGDTQYLDNPNDSHATLVMPDKNISLTAVYGKEPIIQTQTVSHITQTAAYSGGILVSDGGVPLTERGVCWSTHSSPSFADSRTLDGEGSDDFVSIVRQLKPNTEYYVRAYATNPVGTVFGNTLSFTTQDYNTFVDTRDNTVYKMVQIGSQTWMAENLKYLPRVSPESSTSDKDYYWYVSGYNGSQVAQAKETYNYQVYGVLYNWLAAKIACPSGWHLPSEQEWDELIAYVGGGNIAGLKLKESGTDHWKSPNSNTTNDFAFSALPGSQLGSTGDLRKEGYWWSSTLFGSTTSNKVYILMYNTSSSAITYGLHDEGFSIRCIKD